MFTRMEQTFEKLKDHLNEEFQVQNRSVSEIAKNYAPLC